MSDYSICPSCGGRFYATRGHAHAKYCCPLCQKRAQAYHMKFGTLDGLKYGVFIGTAAYLERHNPKLARAKRLAQRDAEYAAHAPKVTVEVRDLRDSELGCIMRVESRGNVPIGWRSCGHVSHT